jgi:hypothetical protein
MTAVHLGALIVTLIALRPRIAARSSMSGASLRRGGRPSIHPRAREPGAMSVAASLCLMFSPPETAPCRPCGRPAAVASVRPSAGRAAVSPSAHAHERRRRPDAVQTPYGSRHSMRFARLLSEADNALDAGCSPRPVGEQNPRMTTSLIVHLANNNLVNEITKADWREC